MPLTEKIKAKSFHFSTATQINARLLCPVTHQVKRKPLIDEKRIAMIFKFPVSASFGGNDDK